MEEKKRYILIDGKWLLFDKLPCAKCEWRYAYVCPQCKWNAGGWYDTYGGEWMTEEEAKQKNEELKNKGVVC